MAVNQRITLRKGIFVGAAMLASFVALLGGLVGRQQFPAMLVRITLSALSFSLLSWLLLEAAQRKLPELFVDTLEDGEQVLGHSQDGSEPEPPSKEIPEGDAVPFPEYDHGPSIQEQQQQSPSLMRQIVEQYTPEQLSKAVRTALDNT